VEGQEKKRGEIGAGHGRSREVNFSVRKEEKERIMVWV
jgi:hypothetical protein